MEKRVLKLPDAPAPLEPGAAAPGFAGGAVAAEPQGPATEDSPSRSPLWVRVLAGLGYTLLGLFLIGSLAFAFGSMWLPSSDDRAAYEQLRAAGQAPDYERQFHIPIPGCVCHSDNPATVMAHSNRRINQCMGCHGG